jgi:hypothetical protein
MKVSRKGIMRDFPLRDLTCINSIALPGLYISLPSIGKEGCHVVERLLANAVDVLCSRHDDHLRGRLSCDDIFNGAQRDGPSLA